MRDAYIEGFYSNGTKNPHAKTSEAKLYYAFQAGVSDSDMGYKIELKNLKF